MFKWSVRQWLVFLGGIFVWVIADNSWFQPYLTAYVQNNANTEQALHEAALQTATLRSVGTGFAVFLAGGLAFLIGPPTKAAKPAAPHQSNTPPSATVRQPLRRLSWRPSLETQAVLLGAALGAILLAAMGFVVRREYDAASYLFDFGYRGDRLPNATGWLVVGGLAGASAVMLFLTLRRITDRARQQTHPAPSPGSQDADR